MTSSEDRLQNHIVSRDHAPSTCGATDENAAHECEDIDYAGPPIKLGFLRRQMCRLAGHSFATFSDGYKRRCVRCAREEWMFSNPYPRIGQPKYQWKHMPFHELKF